MDDSRYTRGGWTSRRLRGSRRSPRVVAGRNDRSPPHGALAALDGSPRAPARPLRAQDPGASLRSLYAVILALGGWFVGVLIASSRVPGVPLDAELLVVFSMAIPIAGAASLGWRAPDRIPGNNVALAAAFAGALIGAWLGFHSATALLALATTLVGAVAGTNLALIACDITAETKRRREHGPPCHPRAGPAVDRSSPLGQLDRVGLREQHRHAACAGRAAWRGARAARSRSGLHRSVGASSRGT